MKKKIISLILVLVMLLSFAGCSKSDSEEERATIPDDIDTSVTDMSDMTYTQSFATLIAKLKEDYCIADYKGIDFDEVYNDMLSRVQEAEKNNDEVSYYRVLFELRNLLYDSHATVTDYDACMASMDYYAGNDYGLSLITKTDGDTVAIMVQEDSQASKAGITTGTVITKWDGRDIEDIKEEISAIYPNMPMFPDAENEEVYKAFMVAGKGGDTVKVNYLDENGDEQEVTLDKIGGYSQRLNDVLELFLFRMKNANVENLSWKITKANQGYIYIGNENNQTTDEENFPEVKETLTNIVNKMKDEKVTDLILDLRSNLGGNPYMSKAIVELFAKDKMLFQSEVGFGCTDEEFEAGKVYIEPDNIWEDVNIVVLVNAETVSSGDILAYSLGKLDNVTLMGVTSSNSSYGSPGDTLQMTDNITFSYPIEFGPDDDNDGCLIDTAEDRDSCIDLDTQIPITDDFIKAVFVDKTDYELQYCSDYINDTFGKNDITREEDYMPETEANTDDSVMSYIGFMDDTCEIKYWQDGKDYSPVVSNGAEITGDGDYNVSLDFTGIDGGKVAGVTFFAVMINNCEEKYPGCTITINSIKINGDDISFTKGYTTSDDGKCTRCNVVNNWVLDMPDDARTQDGDISNSSAVIVDDSALTDIETIEIGFTFKTAE